MRLEILKFFQNALLIRSHILSSISTNISPQFYKTQEFHLHISWTLTEISEGRKQSSKILRETPGRPVGGVLRHLGKKSASRFGTKYKKIRRTIKSKNLNLGRNFEGNPGEELKEQSRRTLLNKCLEELLQGPYSHGYKVKESQLLIFRRVSMLKLDRFDKPNKRWNKNLSQNPCYPLVCSQDFTVSHIFIDYTFPPSPIFTILGFLHLRSYLFHGNASSHLFLLVSFTTHLTFFHSILYSYTAVGLANSTWQWNW